MIYKKNFTYSFFFFSFSVTRIEAENFVQRYDFNQDSKVSVEEINSKEFYDNVSNWFLSYLERNKGEIP